MTPKPKIDNGLQRRADRTPAANRRLAQWRVTWLIEHSASLSCPEIGLHIFNVKSVNYEKQKRGN